MQDEVPIRRMRVLVEMVDAVCVEEGASPLDAMDLIALAEQEVRQIIPVLPGYTSN